MCAFMPVTPGTCAIYLWSRFRSLTWIKQVRRPDVLVPTVMQSIGRLRWIKPVRTQVCEKQICVFQPLEDCGHVNRVKVACCFSDPRILRAYGERRPIRPAALRRTRA